MFERYTEQARRAIFFARYEAVHQPANKISTAHLLIGLTRDSGSRADAVGSLKEKTAQLRAELGIPYPKSTTLPLVSEQKIPLNDNSKMVLAYAAQEAELDEEYWIDTDHLLRGILRFPNEATTSLQSISLDLATARTVSRRHRIEFPPKPSPNKTIYCRLFGSPFRAHRDALVKLLAVLIVCTLTALLIRWLN
ncbi:MAG: Clp protease N-terminal domain-containing protein [Terracidiphilus sp.]|jgi:ATP-dependent Clp protease ATP-binding subunit ClpC